MPSRLRFIHRTRTARRCAGLSRAQADQVGEVGLNRDRDRVDEVEMTASLLGGEARGGAFRWPFGAPMGSSSPTGLDGMARCRTDCWRTPETMARMVRRVLAGVRRLSRCRSCSSFAGSARGRRPLPAHPGRDRTPGRPLDDTAGPQPHHGPRRTCRTVSVPRPRSCGTIHGFLRRGRPMRASRWSRSRRVVRGQTTSPNAAY
jgi:hypothetical protein